MTELLAFWNTYLNNLGVWAGIVTLVMVMCLRCNQRVASSLFKAPLGSTVSAHLYRLTSVQKGWGLCAWPVRLWVDVVTVIGLSLEHCKDRYRRENPSETVPDDYVWCVTAVIWIGLIIRFVMQAQG